MPDSRFCFWRILSQTSVFPTQGLTRNYRKKVTLLILPLLDNDNQTAEALALRQAIYDLHQNLDTIHLEVTHKGVNERISLREVCIRTKHLQLERLERNGQEFKAEKIQGGAIEITVTSLHTQQVRFQHTQEEYNPNDIYSLQEFANLLNAQRTRLRQFYDGCNPRPMHDLVRGDGPALTIAATMQFQCSPEDLLSGLVETIYAMRNALFHGEVAPDVRVLACYEPAYRIVMQFLACVR